MATVSIVLPTHNGEKLITRAIKSVLQQQYSDFELIIVNDGSSDDTKNIIERFARADERIRIVTNKNNLGFAKSLNLGMSLAGGEFIARIDDDDEWICSDKLERQVAFLNAHRDYVMVGTGLIAVDEAGNELGKYLYVTDDNEIRDQSLARCNFAHSSVVFRKKEALDCGGYDGSPEVRPLEDYDLWLKLGIHGKLANINDYCIKYLVRATSMSSNKFVQAKKGIFLTNKYRDNYPHYESVIINRYISLVKYYLLNLLPFSFRVFATTLKSRINEFIHRK